MGVGVGVGNGGMRYEVWFLGCEVWRYGVLRYGGLEVWRYACINKAGRALVTSGA